MFIRADVGERKGGRLQTWKVHSQTLADRLGLPVDVCHYPPRTSKWNKVEHPLFSFISMHWRGSPLLGFEGFVNLSGRTRTKRTPKVKSVLRTIACESGVKIADDATPPCPAHASHVLWQLEPHPSAAPDSLTIRIAATVLNMAFVNISI